MSFSNFKCNENKTPLDKRYSKSLSNESKSLNGTPTHITSKIAGQKLGHKHLPSFFGTDAYVSSFSSLDACKINTTPPLRVNSVFEKKSTSFDITRSNIFCRRYKSSYYETTTAVHTSNGHKAIDRNSPLASNSPARRRQQEPLYNAQKPKNSFAFNELETRSVVSGKGITISSSSSSTPSPIPSNKRTVTGRANKYSATGGVATKQTVDLLQQKRQQFSSKPKAFFKFALPDEFTQLRR